MISAIVIEKQVGWFSTWELSIFINLWEWICFAIGLYLPDLIFKKQTMSVDALTEALLDAGSIPAASKGLSTKETL